MLATSTNSTTYTTPCADGRTDGHIQARAGVRSRRAASIRRISVSDCYEMWVGGACGPPPTVAPTLAPTTPPPPAPAPTVSPGAVVAPTLAPAVVGGAPPPAPKAGHAVADDHPTIA